MTKSMCIVIAAVLTPACVYAVDGQVLINQATVISAGGFPYKITLPGSYKLSGNLVVGGNMHGIDIQADNVTLDLNGFSITGPVSCTGAVSCQGNVCQGPVCTPFSQVAGVHSGNRNITVKNGSIRGFGFGIDLEASAIVSDVHATSNFQAGIYVAGPSVIVHCQASSQGSDGIHAEGPATISESAATNNGNDGIYAVDSTLLHNLAYGNLEGIEIVGGTAIGNAITRNASQGLRIGYLSKVVFGSNTITGNGTDIYNSYGVMVSQNNNVCSTGPC